MKTLQHSFRNATTRAHIIILAPAQARYRLNPGDELVLHHEPGALRIELTDRDGPTELTVTTPEQQLFHPDGRAATPAASPLIDPATEIERLLAVMATLRDPVRGCPWDQVQNFDSIAPYTIEEAYEVADAIARRDMAALPDELGDLLFQVVYHARMAEEAGLFSFATVARAITEKMVRRHPAVFPEAVPAGVEATAGWEAQKVMERARRMEHGTLDGIAVGLPALTRALKITARAGRVGFDWAEAELVLEKLEEEIAEVRAELPGADPARLADEVGDVLFVAANLARKLGLDPEACLRQANAKFSRRFEAMERHLAAQGLALADATLDAMEAEWQRVKREERGL